MKDLYLFHTSASLKNQSRSFMVSLVFVEIFAGCFTARLLKKQMQLKMNSILNINVGIKDFRELRELHQQRCEMSRNRFGEIRWLLS